MGIFQDLWIALSPPWRPQQVNPDAASNDENFAFGRYPDLNEHGICGFTGTIELCYGDVRCVALECWKQTQSWRITNKLCQQIKPPTTMGLSRHHSSASMSAVQCRNAGGFASSVGTGVGRSTSTIARAKTSMSFNHPTSTNTRQPGHKGVRPQTAMTSRKTEEPPSPEKQNCMMPPPSFFGSIQGRKIRKAASIHSMGQQPSTSQREVSISTMMGKLSLKDERAYDSNSKRSQVISNKENCPPNSIPALAPAPVSLRSSSEQESNINFRQSRSDEAAVVPYSRPEECGYDAVSAPKTPPHSAKHALRVLDSFENTLLTSTKKYTQSPTKSPSKAQFLTKDSNIRAFTAWDMDLRLVEVEAQFKQMKEVMNISLKDKTHMEEVIDMAKARGG